MQVTIQRHSIRGKSNVIFANSMQFNSGKISLKVRLVVL